MMKIINTNLNTNLNTEFNLEISNVSPLLIIISITLGGLLWAGFTVAKQNKSENTNVFEDCLSAITDKNISCTENIGDVSTIKVNFLEKQIENILIILEKALSNFIPYYNNIDMHYVYEQLNIIILHMLNGQYFSLHDYSFLLLLFEFIIAVKVGLSKLYLLWYFIKWKYIIWFSSYFLTSEIDVGSKYSLFLFLLLSYITFIYNLYGPGNEYFINSIDIDYYGLEIVGIMFEDGFAIFESAIPDYEIFRSWPVICLLKIWYFIIIDVNWYSSIISSDIEFYHTWFKALIERGIYSSFMPHVNIPAEFAERYLNTETDQYYNIHLFMDYLHDRVPSRVWWQDQRNLSGNDILNRHIDLILSRIHRFFAHILENISLSFWE